MADSQDTTTGRAPAFQFYPKDFLSDENVRMMSHQERGVYITLICLCWIEGTLPADQLHLAKLAGMPLAAFKKLWPALARCFRDDERHGRLMHPRLEKELAKQAIYRRRQSDKGKASGLSRRRDGVMVPVEPEANRGSTVVQPTAVEPKPNSSISDLQSSSSDSSQHPHKEREGVPRARTGGGAGAGTFPRDHMRHRWCGRVCVPDFLHEQFERSTGQTDAVLKAFYTATFDAIPESEPVEPDAPKFWRPIITAKWPPKKQSGDGITAESLAAGIRAARERGDFDARH